MPVNRGLTLRHVLLAVLITFLVGGVAECAFTFNTYNSYVVTTVGSNAILNVSVSGANNPIVVWSMGVLDIVTWVVNASNGPVMSMGQGVLGLMPNGSLTFQNVQLNYSNTYTIKLISAGSPEASTSFTLAVYPAPVCSVQAVNGSTYLQYLCQTQGGPPSLLSFPALNSTASANNTFSLVVPATPNLNGKQISCFANQSSLQQSCSATAGAPQGFLPVVSTTVNSMGLVVSITCNTSATPAAIVTWTKGGQVLASRSPYQISNDTTQLTVSQFNLNSSDLSSYTCSSQNPLGNISNNIQLIGPNISGSGIIVNSQGTVVTLTWEVSPTSIITGFQIQVNGPTLQSSTGSKRRRKRASGSFQTVAVQNSTGRSQTLFGLNPKSIYWFRIVPFAGIKTGPPSAVYQVGSGNQGLSTAAILGLAVGIPCAVFLLIIIALIIICICRGRRRRQPSYPVARTVEKAVTTQPDLNSPSAMLTRGLKNTPQTSPERPNSLPSYPGTHPLRSATTV